MEMGMRTRPAPVTIISLYYSVGAGLILLIVLADSLFPDLQITSQLGVQVFFYIITHHNATSGMALFIVMPCIAIYLLVVACGIWFLMKWARKLTIVTSALTVASWLRAILVRQWAFGETIFQDKLAQETVYVVIFINALILYYLIADADVISAFDNKDRIPPRSPELDDWT